MSAQAIRLTEVDIDNALANGHLGVVFQPVFSLKDGSLMRAEAFVRWDHPGLGNLPPGAFISFFEAQGRMGELSRYVLRRAAEDYRSWQGTGGPGLSINLSQSDIADSSFAGDLARILNETGLPPHLVTLECPPFAPDTSPADAALMLGRLARTGCPLSAEVRGRAGDVVSALDPFPFAEVKTGGSAILRFARTAKGGPGLTAISELLDLANRHGARAIAVGIEDAAAAKALSNLGFDGGQGKLFGGTGPLDDVASTAVNDVRAALGLDALGAEELAELAAKPGPAARTPSKLAPLILGEDASVPDMQAGSEPDDAPLDPNALDPTMMAIMRLKAKKIAAKKAAMKKSEAERTEAERSAAAAAAQQASDTARRLQERLATELDHGPADDTEATAPSDHQSDDGDPTSVVTPPRRPTGRPAGHRHSQAPQGGASRPVIIRPSRPEIRTSVATASLAIEEDAEAGVLLSQNLAEIALGVSRQTSFAEGIRLDGYAPSGGGQAAAALRGAVAPEAEPGVRRGEAKPEDFVDVAKAIHEILRELPVPEDAKPRLIRSASMELANRGMPPAPIELLEPDQSPEDALDEIVADIPMVSDDQDEPEAVAPLPDSQADLPAIARPQARRVRKKTNLLTRKYRITHFWPRSWVRAVRRYEAVRAERAEAQVGNAAALAA